ncbi:serine/threonine protein kinase, CMGC, CDC2/CDK subfamily, partial [Cryomyces antarcticus]
EPQPARAIELAELEGDWHEFESKALRKERDRVDREARRAARGEAEKRKTDGAPVEGERETKRARGEAEGAETEAQTLVEDAQLQE